MKRLTERLKNGGISVDHAGQHETSFHRLATIEDILGEEYDLNRLRELAQADRDGRCVVLPATAVFALIWGAGPGCDMVCPVSIDGEGQCDFCDHGKLFVYECPCRQEHIDQIGKTVFLTREEAEAAMEMEDRP
ncbi:hypothetical protein [Feifania hominis]|uniref:Uncharacterized protein n=1 Tax=Feifania hominis TaxID=2763660 RepID=A0A926HRD5_9FIRM|nr:hypothetical protein [Feifania hominis]MBC8537287.1 hypothetical protein [Feifania hominis]